MKSFRGKATTPTLPLRIMSLLQLITQNRKYYDMACERLLHLTSEITQSIISYKCVTFYNYAPLVCHFRINTIFGLF